MKKTLTAMLLACTLGVSYGAEQVTEINGDSSGTIRVTGTSTYDTYTYSVTADASVDILEPQTGVANIKYANLNSGDGLTLEVSQYVKLNNKAQTNFSGAITLGAGACLDVETYIQFNSDNVNSTYSTVGAITLGQGATISASSIDFVSGQTNQSLSITGIFGEAAMEQLTTSYVVQGALQTTNLITLTGGVKNMTVDATTVSLGDISALNALGYTNKGLITSADQLADGEYGLLYSSAGFQLAGRVIPEPATATLSLLALAGLAARRRRK